MEWEALDYDYGPDVTDEDIHGAILGGVSVSSPALAAALAPKNILDRFADTPDYARLLLARMGNVTFKEGDTDA